MMVGSYRGTRHFLPYIVQLLIFSSLQLVARGSEVRLSPSDIHVDIGSMAVFTCSVSCDLTQTHTVRWFVGHSPSGRRRVDLDFESRTGIQVSVQEVLNCTTPGQTMSRQMLSVNASSSEMLNRTAVQCAALRKAPTLIDYYSHYSVLLVNEEELEVPTPSNGDEIVSSTIEPSQTEENSAPTTHSAGLPIIEPSSCQTDTVSVTLTVSETVTTTVQVTHTVTVTNLSEPPPSIQALSSSANRSLTGSTLPLLLTTACLCLILYLFT